MLIELVQELGIEPKRTSSCNGGEYHSPCPRCDSGVDRFVIWPNLKPSGRYWCRQCQIKGDSIQFCRDFFGCTFQEACLKTGVEPLTRHGYLTPKVRKEPIFIPKQAELPIEKWQTKAAQFVKNCNANLTQSPELINQDKNRGLTLKIIQEFKLGWNPSLKFEPLYDWGLESIDEKKKSICLPPGIVIPVFRSEKLIRVKIRLLGWNPNSSFSKYLSLKGGKNQAGVFGRQGLPVLLLESELDAVLVYQLAGDLCTPVALGSVTNKPDQFLTDLLKATDLILYALDFDDAGISNFAFWKQLYGNKLKAWPTPKEKSPGDAHLAGVDIREWIKKGLESQK